MARPRKDSPERREMILRSLRIGATRRAAAEYAEMDRSTLVRIMQRDASFRDAVAQAEAHAEVRFQTVVADAAFGRAAQHDAEGNVVRAEVQPSPRYAAWWLSRRRREDYAQRITVNIEKLIEEAAEESGVPAAAIADEVDRWLRSTSR